MTTHNDRYELADRIAVLERSNTELSEFAGVVAHDLLEPLTAVIGFLELFERRHATECTDAAAELVHVALESAESMQVLVTALLEYTTTDVDTRLVPVDTNDLVGRVVNALSASLAASGGAILVDDLPTVMGDAVQLGRLFQNLLSNALKFRTPGLSPVVRVSAAPDPDGWCFHVDDNGIGIDPDASERIFGMFKRLHSRTAYPGSGLGLAVCKKVVENHGGRIWANGSLGHGTTISFVLPGCHASHAAEERR